MDQGLPKSLYENLHLPCVYEIPYMPETRIYKCVSGDVSTIQEYVASFPKPSVVESPCHGSRWNVSDWSGLYLQFDLAHALGTVGYRWERGQETARILSACLSPIAAVARVIIVDAPWMPDGSIPGHIKAQLVWEALGLPYLSEMPLMLAVAEQGKVLICRETENQWELVMGPGLPEKMGFMDERVELELKSDKWGCTSHMRASSQAPWRRFDQADPNFQDVDPPSWIIQHLMGNNSCL